MSGDWHYFEERKDLRYYKLVKQWLEELSRDPKLNSVMDVGCADTPVCTWGSFSERTALNSRPFPRFKDVDNHIEGDWLSVIAQADVITCLQVLEHLDDDVVKRFAWKLFKNSAFTIVSVPYMWPRTPEQEHKQDPIDLRKFLDIVGRDPIRMEIVTDGSRQRMVAMFDNAKIVGDESRLLSLYNSLRNQYEDRQEPYGDGTERVHYYNVVYHPGSHVEVICCDDGGCPIGSTSYR